MTTPEDQVQPMLEAVPDHEELDPDTIVEQVQAYAAQLRDQAGRMREQADADAAAALAEEAPAASPAEIEQRRLDQHRLAAPIDFAAADCDRAITMYRDGEAQLAENPDADIDVEYLLAVLRGKRGVQAPNMAAAE